MATLIALAAQPIPVAMPTPEEHQLFSTGMI
jgi:hypothetical protein